MIIAMAGGVGGAKLAEGLSVILPPKELTIVVNTADDFNYWGLSISPDLDTVMYNLAGIHNPTTGWGIKDETWETLAAMKNLDADTWFRIGDKDLATHLERTRLLKKGKTLSEVTAHLCKKMKLKHLLVPMSDESISTKLRIDTQEILDFQKYFVKYQCQPVVTALSYAGASQARPSQQFLTSLNNPNLKGVIICPSNPLLSILPILAIPGVATMIQQRHIPVIAVSPLLGGQALKGPAAKIMAELNIEPSVRGIASCYQQILTGMVIDPVDQDCSNDLKKMGLDAYILDIVMKDKADKVSLAESILQLIR